MEHEKSFGNFNVGIGSSKVAGAGTLDKAVDAPKVRTKYDKETIAKNIVKASLISAGVIIRHGGLKKKKKK